MINTFPTFSGLSLDCIEEISSFVSSLPPYSDFNPTSMWTWDTAGEIRVSWHRGNLVVQFADYITGAPFLSVCGSNDIDDTIADVIDYAREHDMPHTLRLIPEYVIEKLQHPEIYAISEEDDSHDYILSVDALTTLGGNKLRGKKNFSNRFQKAHADSVSISVLELTDPGVQIQIRALVDIWAQNTTQAADDVENERIAIDRMLTHAAHFAAYSVGIFVGETLVAFSIEEEVSEAYGLIHYEKADISYTGIFPFLKQQSAIEFQKRGCEFINYEQDLGIEGLRKAKKSYRPISFLKKYTIAPK